MLKRFVSGRIQFADQSYVPIIPLQHQMQLVTHIYQDVEQLELDVPQL